MPENAGQERTEKATAKKRKEARKKGQVAQSREISSAMILMTALGFFYFAGSWLFWSLSEIITGVYQNIATLRLAKVSDASAFSLEVLYQFLALLLPFLLPIAVVGFIANVMQVGFQIHAGDLPVLCRLRLLVDRNQSAGNYRQQRDGRAGFQSHLRQ